jgi:hypothetical protein
MNIPYMEGGGGEGVENCLKKKFQHDVKISGPASPLVDMFSFMPSALFSPLANLDVNLVSLSDMIFLGTPNCG